MTTQTFCIYCAQDMHFLCGDSCKCDTSPAELAPAPDNFLMPSATRGAPIKVEGFKDQLSTGRKRAASLYPLEDGMICEWAWKENCGGGIVPIMGCSGRPAKHIHHGPDKSVMNNTRENISRVCHHCHNLWHAKNDPYFPQPRPEDGRAWLPNLNTSLEIHGLSEMKDADPVKIIIAEKSLKRTIDFEAIKEQGIEFEKTGG